MVNVLMKKHESLFMPPDNASITQKFLDLTKKAAYYLGSESNNHNK